MNHSNSSISCYLNCQRDYYWKYVMGKREPSNEHLTFGSFGHEQIEKYFQNKNEYVFPSEALNANLKAFFGIQSWELYFRNIFKQIDTYHTDIIKRAVEFFGLGEFEMQILTELKTDVCLIYDNNLNGVIDKCFLFTDLKTGKQYATIVDYKFTNSNKTYDDLEMDSQLYIYANIISTKFNIPVKNISVAYISIPKKSTGLPTILANGTYSKAKSQNVLYDDYLFCLKCDFPNYDENDVNGEYYGILQELKNKRAAYMIIQTIDVDIYNNVMNELQYIVSEIGAKVNSNDKHLFLRKFGKHNCFGCETCEKEND